MLQVYCQYVSSITSVTSMLTVAWFADFVGRFCGLRPILFVWGMAAGGFRLSNGCGWGQDGGGGIGCCTLLISCRWGGQNRGPLVPP